MNLMSSLAQHSSDLPEVVRNFASEFCQQLTEVLSPEHKLAFSQEKVLSSLLKVCCASRFVSDNCLRQPQVLSDLINSGDLFSANRRENYSSDLQALNFDSENALAQQLRCFRRREMLRIAWRDLAGWSDLDETLSDLSVLAEACINTALDFSYHYACQRWGTPTLADGSAFNLVVLGMGKLGAGELNFSSDIDLIFAYAEQGLLTSKKEISYEEFFTRVARTLVKVLDEITMDGFVFRTDLRLRPFGDSGPIVMSFVGMEHYYLTQAREWERYAMIKARQVAGDYKTGKQLLAMIKPFVYRRYLDYGAFEELRGLKLQIMQELKRKDKLDNIKLGPGGIREIEFIGQAFQLIRGGQEPQLQQREIQSVLGVLANLQLMLPEDVAMLKVAYRFLRRVENHIQQYQDKQCHDLPLDVMQQSLLAYSLDFKDWSSFRAELASIRNRVHEIFLQVFSLTHPEQQTTKLLLWNSDAKDEQALALLAEYGFDNPETILQAIVNFKTVIASKHLSSKGMAVVQRLLPGLIAEFSANHIQEDSLQRILDLFVAVSGRNVYLALLVENPLALAQLIKLVSASSWICQLLAQYPILFDELLDARSLYEPLRKSALANDLQNELANIEQLDEERIMICLRQFKHINVLRVAASDLMAFIPVTVVSDYLTWIAEVILEQVLQQAWLILTEKYGFPPGCDQFPSHIAIIAFGKFGGIELGYGSDLDLVFISDYPEGNALTSGSKAINCTLFYLRLGQKIRHILSTKMLSGVLYEVDLRLRPNGDSGLLITHIDQYEDYLQNQAWTWEHQALVRARFICGDNALAQQFAQIRQRILALPRDRQVLKTQIKDMREKMLDNQPSVKAGEFDLKHGLGGITDIEFLVQFGVLAEAANNQQLSSYTDNIRLLKLLAAQAVITDQESDILTSAYCRFRDFGHHQLLKGLRITVDAEIFAKLRAEVIAIWGKLLNG